MPEVLSKRELQIADLVHQGKLEKEIASDLFISTGTVHTHMRRIRQKLGARNIADITRIYILDLKHPVKILTMFFALALQGYIIFHDNQDMRKAKRLKLKSKVEQFVKAKPKKGRKNDYNLIPELV